MAFSASLRDQSVHDLLQYGNAYPRKANQQSAGAEALSSMRALSRHPARGRPPGSVRTFLPVVRVLPREKLRSKKHGAGGNQSVEQGGEKWIN